MDEILKGPGNASQKLRSSACFGGVRTKLLVCVLCTLLVLPASAAPKAQSGDECVFLGDVALVARGLAQEGIKDEAAVKVLRHIYTIQPGRGEEFVLLIVRRAATEKIEAQEFGLRVTMTCLLNNGDVDKLLGVSL